MRNMKRQQGVTLIGGAIILGIIAFFVFLGLKIFPIYLDNFNVKGSLKAMQKEQGLYRKNKAQIRSLLNKKLSVNDIKSVKKKNIKIDKRNGAVIIRINYSVKTELAGALSLLAEFNEKAELVN